MTHGDDLIDSNQTGKHQNMLFPSRSGVICKFSSSHPNRGLYCSHKVTTNQRSKENGQLKMHAGKASKTGKSHTVTADAERT